MPIEDVFHIKGRGTVVSGRVERGRTRIGDKVEIVGLFRPGEERDPVVVTGTQQYRQDIPEAHAGMNVGLLLRGVHRHEVRRGQLIAAPGSIGPHSHARVEIFVLAAMEAGTRVALREGGRTVGAGVVVDVT